MNLNLKTLQLALLGGVVGFLIDFSWSFQNSSLTIVIAAFLYTILGYITFRKKMNLFSVKTLLLFWYLIALLVFASFVNYSHHLPILAFVSFLSYTGGFYLGKMLENKNIATK
jgi:hypothetical protein